MANNPSDSDPTQPGASEQDQLAARVARTSSGQRGRGQASVNATVPQAEFIKANGQYVYETAPLPLKRLFGSPLAQVGPYAQGPGHPPERLVSSGWGDARSSNYDRNVNTSGFHTALDYPAPWGEKVLAAAKGTVSFVGFQGRRGAVSVKGCHARGARDNPPVDLSRVSGDPDAEQILNSKNEVVASTEANNIGFGGIAVYITHQDEFAGYKTGYFHLSNTTVNEGDVVQEGQVIGNIGGTGGYYDWFHKGTHLHFQIELSRVENQTLVRPTSLVPNYWPKHDDSTNTSAATNIRLPPVSTVGGQVVANYTAAVVSGVNRATAMQNKTVEQLRNDQSAYAEHVAQTLDVQRTALHAATSTFQGTPPKVTQPMTFDFDKGVWLVDGKEDGVL